MVSYIVQSIYSCQGILNTDISNFLSYSDSEGFFYQPNMEIYSYQQILNIDTNNFITGFRWMYFPSKKVCKYYDVYSRSLNTLCTSMPHKFTLSCVCLVNRLFHKTVLAGMLINTTCINTCEILIRCWYAYEESLYENKLYMYMYIIDYKKFVAEKSDGSTEAIYMISDLVR